MSFEQDCLEMKVDVGVLKQQVLTLTQLCNKMDAVIEKLSDNQVKMNEDIYEDMDKKKTETVNDIKELHSRITTVDRNLCDKIELTERRIMEEIRDLRKHITDHNEKEDKDIKKILEWKWMAAGGIIVFVWIATNVNFTALGNLFK